MKNPQESVYVYGKGNHPKSSLEEKEILNHRSSLTNDWV